MPYPDQGITDDFPREAEFSAGQDTLLSADGKRVTGVARGGRREKASDFRSRVDFQNIHQTEPIAFRALLDMVRPRAHSGAEWVFAEGTGILPKPASADVR